MIGILTSFEETATWLSPIVLVAPGLIAAGLGLFVWLGGLGFRRTVQGLVGGLIGALAAVFLVNQRLAAVILFAGIGIFVGAVLQRFFAFVLAGVLGVAVAFLIVAWPQLRQDRGASLAASSAGGTQEKLSTQESFEVVRICAVDLIDSIKLAARQLTPTWWGVVVVAGLGSLGGALVLRHLSGALTCSIVGTALIFWGMMLLLLYKGSTPVTRFTNNPGYYVLVFLSMIVFGATEQWLLCRHISAKGTAKKPKKSKSDQGPSKRSWRDR